MGRMSGGSPMWGWRVIRTLPAHCPTYRIAVVTFFFVSPAVFAADQEYIKGARNGQLGSNSESLQLSKRLLIAGYTEIWIKSISIPSTMTLVSIQHLQYSILQAEAPCGHRHGQSLTASHNLRWAGDKAMLTLDPSFSKRSLAKHLPLWRQAELHQREC